MAAPQPSVENALTEADPKLGRVIAAVIARIGRQHITPSHAAPFEALARAVTYQSVSGEVAAVVWGRLKNAVDAPFIPGSILNMSEAAISSVGLSKSKSRAILNLATWFVDRPRVAVSLPNLSDKELVATLTDISGIGVWTANVFLIFDLGRPDVMPAGDLGIRRGVQLACGLKDMATAKQVQDRSQLWRPFRSVASIYLWNAAKLRLSADDLVDCPPAGGPALSSVEE